MPSSIALSRRPLALLLVFVVAAGLAALSAPPAVAAPVVSGRVMDTATGAPLSGFSVRLLQNVGGRPGAVVDTAATNRDGYFSLDAPPRAGGYFVQHLAGRYQAGWVGGPLGERYFQARFANADRYSSGAKLGKIYTVPAFIRGVVVDSSSGARVAGVKVTARSANDLSSVEASDTTDRAGRFELTGIDFEDDGALRFAGVPVGYEVGYLACDFEVVGSFGDACASPLGVLTSTVKLDSTVS